MRVTPNRLGGVANRLGGAPNRLGVAPNPRGVAPHSRFVTPIGTKEPKNRCGNLKFASRISFLIHQNKQRTP